MLVIHPDHLQPKRRAYFPRKDLNLVYEYNLKASFDRELLPKCDYQRRPKKFLVLSKIAKPISYLYWNEKPMFPHNLPRLDFPILNQPIDLTILFFLIIDKFLHIFLNFSMKKKFCFDHLAPSIIVEVW